jgi:phosphoglycolate phosphatase
VATLQCRGTQFAEVQAVIFDKDGTLANVESFLRSLAQRRARLIDAQVPGVQEPLLMAFGIDSDQINPAGLMAVGSRQENEIAAAAYVAETGQDWVKALNIVHKAFVEADKGTQRKADDTPLVNGAFPLLQRLTDAGLTLALLSSDSDRNVQDFVAKYQLENFFSVQVGVDGFLSKAEPQLLEKVMAQLGTVSERTVVVGDSDLDLQIARSLGARGYIGVTGGWSKCPHIHADVLVEHLSEIEVVT